MCKERGERNHSSAYMIEKIPPTIASGEYSRAGGEGRNRVSLGAGCVLSPGPMQSPCQCARISAVPWRSPKILLSPSGWTHALSVLCLFSWQVRTLGEAYSAGWGIRVSLGDRGTILRVLRAKSRS